GSAPQVLSPSSSRRVELETDWQQFRGTLSGLWWSEMEVGLETVELNAGDTAWILMSAALVLFMTPGLAFFYGGMVRGKNVLAMLMQNYVTIGVVSVVWVIAQFSLAFGAGN